MKWGAPAFMRDGIVAGMVAFKAHVRFGFWKAKLMKDPVGLFRSDSASFMNAEKLTDVKAVAGGQGVHRLPSRGGEAE